MLRREFHRLVAIFFVHLHPSVLRFEAHDLVPRDRIATLRHDIPRLSLRRRCSRRRIVFLLRPGLLLVRAPSAEELERIGNL